jgi:hypothetical protein
MRLRIELFLRGSGIMRFSIDWPGSELPAPAEIEAAMVADRPALELADDRGLVTWDPSRADGMLIERLPDPISSPPRAAAEPLPDPPSDGPPLTTLEPLEVECSGCGATVILHLQETGRAAGNCSGCGLRFTKDAKRSDG